MAILKGVLAYTGSMGGLSAYRMRGVDHIVLREKGGPRKVQVKNHPNFDLTRRNNEEWKACMSAVSSVNLSLHGTRHLADYNYTGALSSVCKSIQADDGLREKGRRAILFSQSPYKLEGFGLNKYNPFDTVLKHPLQYELDAATGTALVELPDIIPGIHLINPMKQPFYRIVFVLGCIADIIYDEQRKMYRPVTNVANGRNLARTDWYTSKEKCGAQPLSLALNNWQLQAGVSLILSAGVEFGQPLQGGEIQFTKYAGAAKILKLG
jgi:hypothetical protein